MNTVVSTAEAREALVQVRNAHRLVNAYHRRLLDLLMMTRDAVQERFGELPKMWWFSPQFKPVPKGTFDPTSRWAFDFVALQDAYFNWASPEDPSSGGFYFGIGHTADSALDKALFDDEPDPLAFRPVAESKTLLEAWALATGPCAFGNWQDFAAKRTRDVEASWWEDRTVHTIRNGEEDLCLGGFKVDVADVWTLDSAREHLITPLLTLISDLRGALPSTLRSKGG